MGSNFRYQLLRKELGIYKSRTHKGIHKHPGGLAEQTDHPRDKIVSQGGFVPADHSTPACHWWICLCCQWTTNWKLFYQVLPLQSGNNMASYWSKGLLFPIPVVPKLMKSQGAGGKSRTSSTVLTPSPVAFSFSRNVLSCTSESFWIIVLRCEPTAFSLGVWKTAISVSR